MMNIFFSAEPYIVDNCVIFDIFTREKKMNNEESSRSKYSLAS